MGDGEAEEQDVRLQLKRSADWHAGTELVLSSELHQLGRGGGRRTVLLVKEGTRICC